jgi:hypothetical protein
LDFEHEHRSNKEPDAGDPHVRFGWRGKVQTLVPTPYREKARRDGDGDEGGSAAPVERGGRDARWMESKQVIEKKILTRIARIFAN